MNQRLKVVFLGLPTITASNVAECFTRKPDYYWVMVPIGIVHLASVLENQDFIESVECIDYCLELENGPDYGSYEKFIDDVASKIDYEPDILAYSINYSPQHDFFVRCEKQLKKKWPNSITIGGGSHVTNTSREYFELSSVDYVVRGEAEISFPQMLERIASGKFDEVDLIEGVYSRKSISDAKNLVLSEQPDLEKLPLPSWHIFDMDRYTQRQELHRGEQGLMEEREKVECAIMTSRGCPYSCTFCSSFTVHGRNMRYFPIEWVTKTFQELYDKYAVTAFVVQDDLFTVNKKRVVEVLNSIQEMKIPDAALFVRNSLSVNSLDETVIDALANTGLRVARLAVESGSDHVNKNIMKKRVKLDRVPEIVEMFRERGVLTLTHYIMGFPGETREMMEESIKYAETTHADWCSFDAVKPLVGTPLYDEMVGEGYVVDGPEWWSEAAYGKREFDTKEIGQDELNDLIYEANIRINFFNNFNIGAGNYTAAISTIRDIVIDYPFHVVGLYMLHVCFEKMGNYTESREQLDRIRELVQTDVQAASMYRKYRDKMPDVGTLDFDAVPKSASFDASKVTVSFGKLEDSTLVNSRTPIGH